MEPQEQKGCRLALHSQVPGTPASKACIIPLPRTRAVQRQRRRLSAEVGDLGCAVSPKLWAVGLRVGLSPWRRGRDVLLGQPRAWDSALP